MMPEHRSQQRPTPRGGCALFAFLAAVLLLFSARVTLAQSDYDFEYDSTSNSDVSGTVQRTAKDPAYRFCNDPKYVLHKAERPFCPLAEASALCPEFKVHCQRPSSEDRGELRSAFGRGGKPQGDEPEAEKSDPVTYTPPAWLALIARILFWLIAAALICALAYLIINALLKNARGNETDDAPGGEPPTGPGPQAASPAAIVESDVARLLRRARGHGSAGRYGPAIDDVYAALIRHLEGQQLLVLDRSRTNGDYVRALRQHPDWQRLLRECGRDVERTQFGKREPDASTFERLLARIEPLISRVVMVALIGLSCLLQLSCERNGESGRTGKQWGPLGDTGADGLALFSTLLADKGYSVKHRIRRTKELDDSVGLLIVYDDTSLEDEDWKALEQWVHAGHQLWLAGDAEAAHHFGGQSSGLACEPPLDFGTGYEGDRYTFGTDGTARPLALASVAGSLQAHSDFVPLLTCNGKPMVSQRALGAGNITLFADASWLSNASLLSADNAQVLMSLVRGFPLNVEFAGGLAGTGADSPYEALLNANLGPVAFQIALLMLVLYLARGIPFARLRDPVSNGRRRFIDHLHALGRVFQRAGSAPHALHHYATWALGRLNDRVRPGQRASIIELGSALAKRTGRPHAEIMETLAEAATARNQPEGSTTGDELKVLRKLEAFVIETGGTR